MFGNFRAKRNLYFMFSGSAPFLSKNRFRATKGAAIYRTLQSNLAFKKIGILLAT